MRQTLHIWRKDVRHLWRDICLVWALAALWAWLETHSNSYWWAEGLLVLAAGFLIARLVHDEAIPGDKQFWITRPYRWTSLLAAKLLFILLFVHVPIALAQSAILKAAALPLLPNLSGLAGSHLLIAFCISLPLAALAAVTSSLAPFAFAMLVVAAIALSAIMGWTAFVVQLGGAEWIRDTIGVIVLASIAVIVLYVQYRKRRTRFSRAFALGAAAAGAALYLYLPWSFVLAVQSRLFGKSEIASLQVALDPSAKVFFYASPERAPWIRVDLPLAVRGVPRGAEIRPDALYVTVRAAGGRTWQGFAEVNGRSRQSGTAILYATLPMDPQFFQAERQRPVTVRASVYFTLFGNARARTVRLEKTPVHVLDGLHCYRGDLGYVYCWSAFRWPARLVYAVRQTDRSALTRWISYSPFPAVMGLDPLEARWASGPPDSSPEVTLVSEQPLAHFRRELGMPGLRLAEFAGEAR